jgi:7,8-dihydropterin-6-yl-methyl-4-(beta-D-ribofuranosyl)aminobenzene 5'-phosphate synthase
VGAILGGLHGFRDFDLLDGLEWVCPTHCSQYMDEIKRRYPDKYIKGGVGKVITL